jgi:hypothetical protein
MAVLVQMNLVLIFCSSSGIPNREVNMHHVPPSAFFLFFLFFIVRMMGALTRSSFSTVGVPTGVSVSVSVGEDGIVSGKFETIDLIWR